MYAIVKTGGKQYRVEQGQSLLVERLTASDGDTVTLDPLLFVDGDSMVDGEELAKVSVAARVVGHERGPKLRVVKFKPKRGYKRRTGHRQELTRIEVTEIKLAARKPRAKKAEGPAPVAAKRSAPPEADVPAAEKAAPAPEAKPTAPEAKPTAPEAEPTAPEAKPTAAEAEPTAPEAATQEEDDNGA